MSLVIKNLTRGKLSIVKVSGSISAVDVFKFAQNVRTATNGNSTSILVDISEVEFMDSHALGVLIALNSGLQKKGFSLVILCVNSDPESYINGLINSTKLDQVIRIIRS